MPTSDKFALIYLILFICSISNSNDCRNSLSAVKSIPIACPQCIKQIGSQSDKQQLGSSRLHTLSPLASKISIAKCEEYFFKSDSTCKTSNVKVKFPLLNSSFNEDMSERLETFSRQSLSYFSIFSRLTLLSKIMSVTRLFFLLVKSISN